MAVRGSRPFKLAATGDVAIAGAIAGDGTAPPTTRRGPGPGGPGGGAGGEHHES